jgi:gamma-glutamylcysteine synthetase
LGQEIDSREFDADQFEEFSQRLHRETARLEDWFRHDSFSARGDRAGFELEACLIGGDALPQPINEPFLQRLNDPLVVPELASFNVELNSSPVTLGANALSAMYQELEATWSRAREAATDLDARLVMIGILPTVTQKELVLDNMSSLERYHGLNQQVLRMRGGRPIQIDIRGHQHLLIDHGDVMLESAATSFQIHLKTTQKDATRAFNLSKIISAPMVAISANSPFLFGRDLWSETRIPLFEQSVSVGGSDYSKRVTFGIRYVENSLVECFQANRDRYPVLLPMLDDHDPDTLPHLRLHNGTIWRWTRPLLGFDDDGTPHLRIEHRVTAAGPTTLDSIANAAFYFGLIYGLSEHGRELESKIPFVRAQKNFYAAAREGLSAKIIWSDGKPRVLSELILEHLLPAARKGLDHLGIDVEDARRFLGIIEDRARFGRTGASWQRSWVASYGMDAEGLVESYLAGQESGKPVHAWPLSC